MNPQRPITSREPPLRKMFAGIPGHYDLVNRVVTLGLDEKWRARAAEASLEGAPRRILDLCAGTGDLTVMLAKRAGSETEIVAADFSAPMLGVGMKKAHREGVAERIAFELLDAAQMPFRDLAFDAVTISFGFRNLTFRNSNREKHLSEIFRIIAPGGRLVIVESSRPDSALVSAGFRLWVRLFVKRLGKALSGDRGAYRYLANSIENFYRPGEIKGMLVGAGFSTVRTTQLFLGAAALHVAEK